MANFSKNIESKYGINTYEDTKKTYEWIEKSAKKWGGSKTTIDITFQFSLGNIMCTAHNIQEFCEITYGVDNYSFIALSGCVFVGKRKIYLDYLINFSITANNKVDLESFINTLENTTLDKKDESPITYIESQTNIENQNNTTFIHGNNNTTVTQSNNVNINPTKKEYLFKTWIVAVLQNILSNWIWYLLTMGIGFLISYCLKS